MENFSKESFKLLSEQGWGEKKALVYPQLKIKLKKKRSRKILAVVLKKFQYLCAVRLSLTVLGKVLSQASGFCLLLTAQKSAFPAPSGEAVNRGLCGCVTHGVCGEIPAAGAALQNLCPQLLQRCLAAGKCWAPSAGASKIRGSLTSLWWRERFLANDVCLDFHFSFSIKRVVQLSISPCCAMWMHHVGHAACHEC